MTILQTDIHPYLSRNTCKKNHNTKKFLKRTDSIHAKLHSYKFLKVSSLASVFAMTVTQSMGYYTASLAINQPKASRKYLELANKGHSARMNSKLKMNVGHFPVMF